MSDLIRSPSDDAYTRAQWLYPMNWIAWRGDEIVTVADNPRALKLMIQAAELPLESVLFGFVEPADVVCVY